MLQQICDKNLSPIRPGKLNQANNDRASSAVCTLVKQHHFSSVDQVALSEQTATAAPGEASSSCRLPANDPAKQHAHMSKACLTFSRNG
ncbi:hypothetical protein [Xanthomonas sacchari]|uniref:hypothetical protein n=1 Tax=Xanthomonas sacchari TaxID=56458 RepID=UPI003529607F